MNSETRVRYLQNAQGCIKIIFQQNFQGGRRMTVVELIAAARRSTVNDTKIADLRKCVSEAEKRFEDQASRKFVSGEALSRTYSL